jgi:hypothetical protein
MANRFLSNIQINDAYTFPASDGSLGQAIITDGAGNLSFGNVASGNTTLYQDNFTGNGATTDFTLANSVNNEIKTLVFLNGVYQFKDTYSVSGTTLSFDTAPANGTLIEVITIGSAASQADIDKLAGIEAGAQVNTLDGSGTANYVSKWSDADTITNSSIQDDGSTVSVGGNLAVDTNALFVDAANNWVGIGTSSPSRPIHILAPTPGIKLEDTTGNDFGEIVSVDGDLYIRADEGATQADSSIRFQIDQSERVRIDSSGNVGIGTSPDSDAELHVYRNASAARVRVEREFNPKLDLESLSGYAQIGTLNNFPLAFQTNGAERMRITSSGNVGIGASSPTYKMEIDGGSAETRLRISTSGIDADEAGIILANSTKTAFNDGIQIAHGAGITTFKDLAGEVQMAIDVSNSRVGIGTSSPASLLHLVEDSGQARLLIEAPSGQNSFVGFQNTGGTQPAFLIGYNATDSACVFYDDIANTERMRITSSGNVGIGTSNADYLLTAFGNAQRIGLKVPSAGEDWSDTDLGGFVFRTHFGTQEKTGMYAVGNFATDTYQPNLVFRTSAADRLVIKSSGNVGIGISSPSTTIHVNSGATNEVATFESTDSTAIVIIKDNTAKTELLHSGANFSIQVDPDNTGAASSFIINMDGTEKLRMHPQYLRLASGTGGIQFNGDTAAANALDDYEEGTWSPVYEPTTGSFATMTMDILNANYTKIGRLVTIVAQIRTDDVDVTGGSGNVLISGLPYTAVLSSGGGGAISVGFTSDFVNAPTRGGFTNNGTTIILRVGTTPMAVADLTDGTSANENTLYFTASYITS